MDVALVVAWIAFVISLGTALGVTVKLWGVVSDQDVAELAEHVTSLRKAHRAEQMRRVRQTPGAPAGGVGGDEPPPELTGLGTATRPETKEQLRARVLGRAINPLKPH